jgi:hypothetical protein
MEYADNRAGSPVVKDPAGEVVSGLPSSIPLSWSNVRSSITQGDSRASHCKTGRSMRICVHRKDAFLFLAGVDFSNSHLPKTGGIFGYAQASAGGVRASNSVDGHLSARPLVPMESHHVDRRVNATNSSMLIKKAPAADQSVGHVCIPAESQCRSRPNSVPIQPVQLIGGSDWTGGCIQSSEAPGLLVDAMT